MKLSVKLQDEHQQQHQVDRKNHRLPPILLGAKIPVTIFNLPFLSHFSTTASHPSDLSLSLSTNFSSGPSLKLSYATTSSAASPSANPPFTLTLKSGTGVFGSPKNSPLVISAHFSFNPSNPSHPNPTFSLFLKPQLGSFSLRKTTFSHPVGGISSEPTTADAGLDPNSFAFVPLERPEVGKDLSVVGENDYKSSILKGIHLMAMTQIPMAKRVSLNCRWGVSFPEDLGFPAMRINKIGLQRVDEVVEEDKERKKKSDEGNRVEMEMVKGMCFWMKRELDVLTRINSEMKSELAEMKARARHSGGGVGAEYSRESVRKKVVGSPSEEWRSKKNGVAEDSGLMNGKKEEKKKNSSLAIDVENELQRAIKAAASCP